MLLLGLLRQLLLKILLYWQTVAAVVWAFGVSAVATAAAAAIVIAGGLPDLISNKIEFPDYRSVF